jgi:hypothetical protein
MVIAPMGTLILTHMLKKIQEDGGVSKHFRSWATSARAWSSSNNQHAGATWDGDYKYDETAQPKTK